MWSSGDAWGSLPAWALISAFFLFVTVLQTLKEDSEPSVRALAGQTIHILSSPRAQPRLGWILRALCCWCC